MAKMVVLSCEVCGVIDSTDNRVVTANVCGHRVELCQAERVKLLTLVGVSEAHAKAYCDLFDQQAGTKGTNPSMAQVVEMLAATTDTSSEPELTPEQAQEELVSVGAGEDTGVEAAPRSKRR